MLKKKRDHKRAVFGKVLSIHELRRACRDAVLKASPDAGYGMYGRTYSWKAEIENGGGGFYGHESPEDAIEAMVIGRADLVRQTRVKHPKVDEMIAGMVKQPSFSPVGATVSVPRYLQGHPKPMRRIKHEYGGLQRVVIEGSSIFSIESEYRLGYMLGALGIAQSLSMRGPTELLICVSGAAGYAGDSHGERHVACLIPVGMSPWDISLLCGLSTSGVIRGFIYGMQQDVYHEARGVWMESGLPCRRMQMDDMLESCFDDWDAERSVMIPQLMEQEEDPIEHCLRDAVWGSAL